jgi:translation initiation factor 5A
MAEVSDSEDIVDFSTGESGSSLSFPMQCSSLRKGGFVLIKDRPCKIVEMSTSKTGKHGHAKVNMVGIDIFNSKKYEDICPSTHNMSVPNVQRKEYSLLDISEDNYVSLMDDQTSTTRDDIKLPEDPLGAEIKAKFENDDILKLTVLKAMGEEMVMTYKLDQKQ